MKKDRGETNWQTTSVEALSGIRAWREAHPNATVADMEAAVDERLGRLRRQVGRGSGVGQRGSGLGRGEWAGVFEVWGDTGKARDSEADADDGL
jgi:hypothetical protein